MTTTQRVWLVLCYGDERAYAGNVGYSDDPARLYRYDSDVPNHKQLGQGDVLFLLDRERLLGLAKIERVEQRRGLKSRQRCPRCRTSAIKARKRLTPLFRCRSGHEFDKPSTEQDECTDYAAHYENTFLPATSPITRQELYAACVRWSDQQSMREMDYVAAQQLVRGDALLAGLFAPDASGTPEIEDALGMVAEKCSGRTAQGYRTSSEERRAVELLAMQAATAHYRDEGWPEVRDVSVRGPLDLVCIGAGRKLRVEVKGTTSDGSEVLLTLSEAQHARRYFPSVALFVLAEVELRYDADGSVVARGGKKVISEPWCIDEGDLLPVGFRYRLPHKATER